VIEVISNEKAINKVAAAIWWIGIAAVLQAASSIIQSLHGFFH
jgi:hypothetical protein